MTRSSSRVESAFVEAMALTQSDRSAHLAALATNEPVVATEVQAYLAALDSCPDFLEDPASLDTTFATDLDEPDVVATPLPTQIGRYRILSRLGAGGMGEVYAAEQQQPRRTVALKLLRRERASEAMLRRFQYEVELLARVRHNGIAQILDAGTQETEDGPLPYYAMELIGGARDLLSYAKQENLSRIDRIQLFLQVCDAVEAAHQHGIIHRDIKPGNILVGDEGVPKLIDFGVARAAGPAHQLESMHTQAGQMIGTLRYMSPEQCSSTSAAVDLRADVYALGVVLYELLCGQPPYDLERVPFTELGRVIREDPPRRPRLIQPDLVGDLETIMLKTLEKEPHRRYRSVADLADDLRRFLAHEPIEARPTSTWYRLRLFARRRRGLVATTTLVAGVLIASGIGLTNMYLQTAEALRDMKAARAAEQAAEAELAALRGQVEDQWNSKAAALPDRLTIGEIVFATRESMQEATSVEEKSLLVGSALNTLARLEPKLPRDEGTIAALADTYQKLGDLQGLAWQAGADEVQQSARAYRRAVTLFGELAERTPQRFERRFPLIEAETKLVDTLRKMGKTREGLALADTTIERAEVLFDDSGSRKAGLKLIWALNARGDAAIPLPNGELGLQDTGWAIRVGERLAEDYPNDPDVLHALAWTHFRMGIWQARRNGNLQAGLAEEERSIACHRAVQAARPNATWPLIGLHFAAGHECQYLWELGRKEEALQRMLGYLHETSAVLDRNPDETELLGGWWTNVKFLVRCLRQLDRPGEAQPWIEEAIRRAEAVGPDAPAQTHVRQGHLEALRLASEFSRKRDPAASKRYALEAEALAEMPDCDVAATVIHAFWSNGETDEARARAQRFLFRYPDQRAKLPTPLREQSTPPTKPARRP